MSSNPLHLAEESTAIATGTVTVLSGSTFALSQPNGDLHRDAALGFFSRDLRYLSRWHLDVDGREPQLLTRLTQAPWRCRFIGRVVEDGVRLLVERDRFVDENAMHERVILRNLTRAPLSLTVTLEADTDFASLFAVKDGRVGEPPAIVSRVEDDALVLSRAPGSEGERPEEVRILAAGATFTGHRIGYAVRLGSHECWHTAIHVTTGRQRLESGALDPDSDWLDETVPARRQRQWQSSSAELASSSAGLCSTWDRSREDLGSLRMFDGGPKPVVAAGSPWFMTLFGRDSLLTSYMALPLDPTLAEGVLHALARRQGTTIVPESEEQPGRIMHEVRAGNDHEQFGGHPVYYGTVDATPLFVALLGEYARWHGRCQTVSDLLPAADRALAWIDDYGDRDGDGFVEYERMTPEGLANQGWKDSWDGITFADGSVAQAPIALCEVQGYVYAAFRARARLADLYEDHSTAHHWRRRAARLRTAFNDRFWLGDRGWFALGLDADKRPIDALASNMGQALGTGIVAHGHAARVAELMLSPEMFTGWGVRTLASNMGAYDPLSYHNGSVWPHDSALIAYGLMRAGRVRQAQTLALGLLDAAAAVGGRLPELFAGISRDEIGTPVPYPTACSPQAWASAAPVHLVRALLGLEPSVGQGLVCVSPHIPTEIREITVSRIALAGGRLSVRASGEQAQAQELPPGLRWMEV